MFTMPGIPHYRLQECYDAIPELQAVKPLTLAKSLRSLRLNLYDEEQRKMVSFKLLKGRQLRPRLFTYRSSPAP